jgi:hypothetical protein
LEQQQELRQQAQQHAALFEEHAAAEKASE